MEKEAGDCVSMGNDAETYGLVSATSIIDTHPSTLSKQTTQITYTI